MRKLFVLAHFFGLCSLLAITVYFYFMLVGVLSVGYFVVWDDSKPAVILEIVVTGYGATYAFYLFGTFIGKLRQK